MVNVITEATYEKEVLQSDKPVILDLYADWCGPCKMMAPVIADLSEKYPDIKFCKINVDKAPGVAGANKVFSIPTFLLIRDGEVKNRIVGAVPPAQIEEALKAL